MEDRQYIHKTTYEREIKEMQDKITSQNARINVLEERERRLCKTVNASSIEEYIERMNMLKGVL